MSNGTGSQANYALLDLDTPPVSEANTDTAEADGHMVIVKTDHTRSSGRAPKVPGRFVMTFVGDTMFQNHAWNWAVREHGSKWEIDEGFTHMRPLLEKSDYIVMNLEATINKLNITDDPHKRKTYNYSFGMDPLIVPVLQDLKIDAVGLANNHIADRNVEGWMETQHRLSKAGIKYFGTGLTETKKADPLIVESTEGLKVGVTGFMSGIYCCDELPVRHKVDGKFIEELTSVTLRPNRDNSKFAASLLDEEGVHYKIAFAHWINNYVPTYKENTIHDATDIARGGYDLTLGSAGSHTVKPFDWIKGVPTFFDIGNFVFMKPGKFWKVVDGKRVLPYGTVTHVIFENNVMKELEVHCTLIDNAIVNYHPRPCSLAEAEDLFSNLGPYVKQVEGENYAIIDLQKR